MHILWATQCCNIGSKNLVQKKNLGHLVTSLINKTKYLELVPKSIQVKDDEVIPERFNETVQTRTYQGHTSIGPDYRTVNLVFHTVYDQEQWLIDH